ncbi:MAG: hypothetical protein O4808_20140 [Trichodesmium sp. St17_bin3_1_1]|nr:hypothetical protein [Trichodesmium sp. St17_bin3_1_1]
MSIRGKNPTAFYGTGNREKRIGKSFKSFIYFLICRNLWVNCYRNLRVGYGKIPCLKSSGKS